MVQFNVYRNPSSAARIRPYLLDVQSDLIEPLATTVVVPLIPAVHFSPISHLNPRFEIEGTEVVMSTAEIAGVPKSAIGEWVCSLEDRRSEIVGALDFLISGF